MEWDGHISHLLHADRTAGRLGQQLIFEILLNRRFTSVSLPLLPWNSAARHSIFQHPHLGLLLPNMWAPSRGIRPDFCGPEKNSWNGIEFSRTGISTAGGWRRGSERLSRSRHSCIMRTLHYIKLISPDSSKNKEEQKKKKKRKKTCIWMKQFELDCLPFQELWSRP